MARDIGVMPDYVDRAFRATDASGGWNGEVAAAQKAANWRSKRAAVAAVKRLQASRPLKPPGR